MKKNIIQEMNEELEKVKNRNLIEWLKSDINMLKVELYQNMPKANNQIIEKEFLLTKAEDLSKEEYTKGLLWAFLCSYKYLMEKYGNELANDFLEEFDLINDKCFNDMKNDLIINVQENKTGDYN